MDIDWGMMMVALIIFLGSFLLFGIQPMLGRLLLPGFGGSAAVWSVCLAAYQVLLLCGYLYAHGVTRLARTKQWQWHTVALVLAGAWSVAVARWWPLVYGRIGDSSVPGLEVLLYVFAFIGLPYLLLSSGSSLLQAWLVRRRGRNVYMLYAVSNLGSFLGLFFYPLVVERFVSLAWQWWGFATAFCVYAVLVIGVGRGLSRQDGGAVAETGTSQDAAVALPGALARPWLWVALPGMSSFLLVAITNHLTLDVTPVPLMWAILLGLFLLSYVVGFSRLGERGIAWWMFLAVFSVIGLAWLMSAKGPANRRFLTAFLSGGTGFLCICIFLHGWLYTIRPAAKDALTRFYLGIAVGGAAGGILGSLVCPLVFKTIMEWPLGVFVVAVGVFWFILMWKREDLEWYRRCALVALAGVPVLIGYGLRENPENTGRVLLRERNFYGTLTVTCRDLTEPGERRQELFSLTHGKTLHGLRVKKYWDDVVEGPERTMAEKAETTVWEGFPLLRVVKHPTTEDIRPSSYYGPAGGGAGVIMRRHTKGPDETLRVGLVGLGAGTMAVWGEEGDLYRFYEINPEVPPIALDDRHFVFLSGAKADVEIVIGDARKILEAEDRAGLDGWDVLVIDAYSGDSIPFHLATREAFELYRRRLAPGGILAVHLSNWHIDLLPLVKAVATETGMKVHGLMGVPKGEVSASNWAFLAEEDFALVYKPEDGREVVWDRVKPLPHVPTDTCGSLIPLIKFGGNPNAFLITPSELRKRLREQNETE